MLGAIPSSPQPFHCAVFLLNFCRGSSAVWAEIEQALLSLTVLCPGRRGFCFSNLIFLAMVAFTCGTRLNPSVTEEALYLWWTFRSAGWKVVRGVFPWRGGVPRAIILQTIPLPLLLVPNTEAAGSGACPLCVFFFFAQGWGHGGFPSSCYDHSSGSGGTRFQPAWFIPLFWSDFNFLLKAGSSGIDIWDKFTIDLTMVER